VCAHETQSHNRLRELLSVDREKKGFASYFLLCSSSLFPPIPMGRTQGFITRLRKRGELQAGIDMLRLGEIELFLAGATLSLFRTFSNSARSGRLRGRSFDV